MDAGTLRVSVLNKRRRNGRHQRGGVETWWLAGSAQPKAANSGGGQIAMAFPPISAWPLMDTRICTVRQPPPAQGLGQAWQTGSVTRWRGRPFQTLVTTYEYPLPMEGSHRLPRPCITGPFSSLGRTVQSLRQRGSHTPVWRDQGLYR